MLTLANLLTTIEDRATELGLATRSTAEEVRYLNLAVKEIRNLHEFEEVRATSNLSFTRSSTLSWATVAQPADFWWPIELNNATYDYEFHFMRPTNLRSIDRGSRYTYDDVDQAFAIDGSNFIIRHSVTETLPLEYYSKYLVYDVSAVGGREDFVAADTTDYLRINNDELVITRTLMFIMEKEPGSVDEYAKIRAQFFTELKAEQIANPSQAMELEETIKFMG